MKLLIYLIGFAFFFALYGIYNAVTIHYFTKIIHIQFFLFYLVKLLECLLFIWVCHQTLKRHVYWKQPLSEAFVGVIKLLGRNGVGPR